MECRSLALNQLADNWARVWSACGGRGSVP